MIKVLIFAFIIYLILELVLFIFRKIIHKISKRKDVKNGIQGSNKSVGCDNTVL